MQQFFFPAGLAVDPAGDVAYVTNANGVLRFDGGSVAAVRLRGCVAGAEGRCALDALDAFRGGDRALCEADAIDPRLGNCDETPFHLSGGVVEIGNFAGPPIVQSIPGAAPGSPSRRLLIPVRGDPSITWVDVVHDTSDSATLRCEGESVAIPGTAGAAGTTLVRCTGANRMSRYCSNGARTCDPSLELSLPTEPFGVALDATLGFLFVTHLSRGEVTLVDVRNPAGQSPAVVDVRTGLFDADATGLSGAFSIAPRKSGDVGGLVYVTSRNASRIATVTVSGDRLGSGPTFTMDALNRGTDNRGVVFAPDGSFAYILSRSPASLAVVDTRLRPDGRPANQVVDVVNVCSEPSQLAARVTAAGLRLYIVCFAAGEVWAMDAATRRVLEVIRVGRGPNAVAFSETAPARLLVSNFNENTIAVVDAVLGSPTEHLVLGRIGLPEVEVLQ
jgi:DNA-binding beta-propeller fold protein YncE